MISKGIAGVECNAVFLCTVKTDEERLDLRRDNLGVWMPGHRRAKESYRGREKCTDDMCSSYVWRISSTNKAYPKLKRTEIFRRSKNSDGSIGSIINPVVVHYLFDGEPVEVVVGTHGNSKSDLPFYPSDRSLLRDIREQVTTKTHQPANVYNKVCSC